MRKEGWVKVRWSIGETERIPGRRESMHEDLKCGVTWNCKSFNPQSWNVGSARQEKCCKRWTVLTFSESMKELATLCQVSTSLPGQCGFLRELDWQICSFSVGRFLAIERKKILFSFSAHTPLLRLHFWSPMCGFFSSHWPIL